MKRLLPLLAALLLVSGCKKDNIVILTPVYVSLGDFEVINGDQSTAKDEPLATYSGVKAVTLARCTPPRHRVFLCFTPTTTVLSSSTSDFVEQ